MNMAKDRLIVALDVDTLEKAENLVDLLEGKIDIFKVGLELFLNTGGKAVEMIHNKGKRVFLDLKFHDITNTVTQAAHFAVKQNIFMFNVHAAGGSKMMAMVAEAAKTSCGKKPLAIAVTVLTNLNNQVVLDEMQSKLEIEDLAEHWAKLAQGAGLDGVVASPWELSKIKATCGRDFKVVCPGVRPAWAAVNDQERIMTPAQAISEGADFLVVGRPIIKAANPEEAAEKVLNEIEEALKNGK